MERAPPYQFQEVEEINFYLDYMQLVFIAFGSWLVFGILIIGKKFPSCLLQTLPTLVALYIIVKAYVIGFGETNQISIDQHQEHIDFYVEHMHFWPAFPNSLEVLGFWTLRLEGPT